MASARALAVASADRAKDRHFRFFGTVISALPFPHVTPDSHLGQELIRIARQAEAGLDVQEHLDLKVTDAYGIEPREMAVLARFLAAKTGSSA